MRLVGQVALVAGATGRIGGVVVAALRAEGAVVVPHGRRPAPGVLAADLSQPGAAAALVAEAAARHGVPLLLVNLVHSPFSPRPLLEGGWEEQWLPGLVNGLRPAVELTRAVLPGMRSARFGRIVHVSGGLSTRPARGCAAYSAAKSALNTLARSTALEHGAEGVTANVVAPGEVREEDEAGDAAYAGVNAMQRATQAVPGTARPEEVAQAVLAFLDPAARFLTGQVLYVNGGQVMP
jgi:3-oxoacyl-[acyl-carrier protein] reductase